jgi:hypothetical protein
MLSYEIARWRKRNNYLIEVVLLLQTHSNLLEVLPEVKRCFHMTSFALKYIVYNFQSWLCTVLSGYGEYYLANMMLMKFPLTVFENL